MNEIQIEAPAPAGRGSMTARLGLISGIACLLGLISLGVGAWEWRREATRAPFGAALAFEPMTREIGPIAPKEKRLIEFRVTNRDGRKTAHLLGAEDKCGASGCVTWKGSPMAILPGQSANFAVEWMGSKPGRVTQKIPIYTDAPGQVEVILTISGEVTPVDATHLP